MGTLIGRQLGRYRIIESLGKGGMGHVYRARDTRLDRDVAVKILATVPGADRSLDRRFEREGKLIASLNHPNIVTIFAVEEFDGVQFLAMELVEGKTLAEVIPPGGLPLDRIFEIAISLSDALSYAHEKGITHRDLKPLNIMFDADGRVKVLDFGLAKLVSTSNAAEEEEEETVIADQQLTTQGQVLGTVAYMSPEQAEGKPLDQRSDIFSLGIILYEMATGGRPFCGDTPISTMSAILRDTPLPVTQLKDSLPRHLGRVIGRCLEKSPATRFQTAREVHSQLVDLKKEIESGEQGELMQRTMALPPTTPGRRSRRTWYGFAVVAAALTIAAYALFLRSPVPVTWKARAGLGDAPSGEQAGKIRVVVLPLENLGPPSEEYFAAGLTDEITTRLASISGLGVVSRTSALHYRESRPSIAQIGKELAVDYILEGTVRWSRGAQSSRVRITPRLIRVADDTNLISTSFDGPIGDIFELQTKVAEDVARLLGATILTRETQRARPTRNAKAYEAYLRGLHFTRGVDFSPSAQKRGVDALTEAVTLDPEFALAHSELAKAHAQVYFFGIDTSPERAAQAEREVERAIELAPDDPEVRLALAIFHYYVKRDYARASRELAIAEEGLPGSVEVISTEGYLMRRQGRWQEAVARLELGLTLSPRDANALVELGETYTTLRRYPEAHDAYQQSIAIDPAQTYSYVADARNYWLWTGGTNAARKSLEALPESEDPPIIVLEFMQLFFEGRYRDALEFLERKSLLESNGLLAWWDGVRPVALLQAWAHKQLGEDDQARREFEDARALLEAEVERYPDDPRLHSALGLALAGLGRTEAAVREAKKATELLPLADDAYSGWNYLAELALVYTAVGETEAALAQIEQLLSIPSEMSMPLLELDPRWQPLRGAERFERLEQKTF